MKLKKQTLMYYPVEEVIQLEQLVALYKRLAYYSNEINKTLNNDKIVNYYLLLEHRKEIRETISLIELIEPLFYNVNATDDKVKEDYAKLDKIRLKVEDTIPYFFFFLISLFC